MANGSALGDALEGVVGVGGPDRRPFGELEDGGDGRGNGVNERLDRDRDGWCSLRSSTRDGPSGGKREEDEPLKDHSEVAAVESELVDEASPPLLLLPLESAVQGRWWSLLPAKAVGGGRCCSIPPLHRSMTVDRILLLLLKRRLAGLIRARVFFAS